VLGVTALASFMMALDALVITTAFATIRADFDRSVETLQWAINIFNLTFAVLLLTGAALGSRFGRRRILVATFSASAAVGSAAHFATGYNAAMKLAGLLALLGALAGLWFPARQHVASAPTRRTLDPPR
jgi:MFS family permease